LVEGGKEGGEEGGEEEGKKKVEKDGERGRGRRRGRWKRVEGQRIKNCAVVIERAPEGHGRLTV